MILAVDPNPPADACLDCGALEAHCRLKLAMSGRPCCPTHRHTEGESE